MSEAKTIVLGAEHDDVLFARLVAALQKKGATRRSGEHFVVGSQELDLFEVDISGDLVKVESETFMGLSITGPAELVEELAAMVRAEEPPTKAKR